MGQKDDILVSVIMGVYNQRDYKALEGAVLSILNQNLRELEFIIYDDGSDAEAGSYIKDISTLDERIVLIGKEENNGLAFSLNACIERARGRYIARMDADDVALPQRLKVQYDFLESHPGYAWCGTNTLLFDDSGVWGRRKMPEFPEKEDYLPFSPYVHPTVMMQRSLFQDNEGYCVSRETLRCEDYEIFMRLNRAGYRGCNIQQELFLYREDKESFRRRKFRFRLNEAKLRYRNFREMGLLFPKGIFYVLRPLAGSLIPPGAIAFLKRHQTWRRDNADRETRSVAAALQENFTEKSSA